MSMTEKLDHWIGGRAVVPESGAYALGANPANGSATVEVAQGDDRDVARAAEAAEAARESWRFFPAAERGRLMRRVADRIRAEADFLADIEISDTGKPRATALTEIENSAAYFEFYAGLVNLPIGDTLDVDPGQHVYTKREPYGVVGIITPWNVPLNQAARACAPALAAGNTIVAKPAEISSQSTIALARFATEEGMPDGVFNVVLGRGSTVGTAIVSHPKVRKVAFTGSVATGQAIGRIAAERVIPLTLELGGKSANIVFDDADLDFAATEAARAFAGNAGQVCSAGTRLLVHRSIHDSFVEKVAAAVERQWKVGETVGPLITEQQYEQVKEYFDVSQSEGVTARVGGTIAADESLKGGYYVEPTIYTGVTNDMRIAREEVFGPVVVAIPFDTEEEALQIANDSEFGLISGVWTRDISRALRLADRIEAGQVFVNTWSTGAVETPFGGHKYSGYGREKGIEALSHYTHLKCVVVKL